ncbi:FprA family A-type flavoprotein [Candidatus Woesearchaeota archaeon]|nr:MAG: FprA family A-type flavoprotein [Candidatus Woesearchaeota archaeon]
MKTHIVKITPQLYLLRLDDDKTRYFEAIWEIPEGITYNSYLLLGQDKNILFDTWKHTYTQQFIETLSQVISPRDIDQIIVHHMEQDHSGALPKILEEAGNKPEIIGHPLTNRMIQAFYGIKPKFKDIKDGETIPIGDKTIKIIHTPWLHWPETIMSYIIEDNVLLTCDAFGGYSIPPTIFDKPSIVEEYLPHVRKYIVTVIGNYLKHIPKAVEKLQSLEIKPKIIAPSHGLIFKNNPETIIKFYLETASGKPEDKTVIIYSTMYGEIGEAINQIIKELENKQKKYAVFRYDDKNQPSIAEALSETINAKTIIIGVATYEADVFPTINYITDLIIKKIPKNKQILIVSSYGWGKTAGRKLSQKLSQAGFKIIDTIEFHGKPKETEVNKIKEVMEKITQ